MGNCNNIIFQRDNETMEMLYSFILLSLDLRDMRTTLLNVPLGFIFLKRKASALVSLSCLNFELLLRVRE